MNNILFSTLLFHSLKPIVFDYNVLVSKPPISKVTQPENSAHRMPQHPLLFSLDSVGNKHTHMQVSRLALFSYATLRKTVVLFMSHQSFYLVIYPTSLLQSQTRLTKWSSAENNHLRQMIITDNFSIITLIIIKFNTLKPKRNETDIRSKMAVFIHIAITKNATEISHYPTLDTRTAVKHETSI